MRHTRPADCTALREPSACTPGERSGFVRLVREGFPQAARLERRVATAHLLAFRRAQSGDLIGVAALKKPSTAYRRTVLRSAAVPAAADDFPLELGWVFVVPERRGAGIAADLCRALVTAAPGAGVFATTRPDNGAMMRLLGGLGFARCGTYRRRDEELTVWVLEPPSGASTRE